MPDIISFLHFGITDILDILLLSIVMYQLYKLMRGTQAMSIFVVVIIFYVAWLVTKVFHMRLVSTIMGQIMGVGVLAIIVVFQPEIRRFLLKLGNKYMQKSAFHSIFRAIAGTKGGHGLTPANIDEITLACERMSSTKTGALIAIQRVADLGFVVETGDEIDALINRRLIDNIFFKNTALHDGAMVIAGNRIVAARCTLPMSESQKIPPQYGMRHRAAVGLSEQTDALLVVVSEETGSISVIVGGEILTMHSSLELRLYLENGIK